MPVEKLYKRISQQYKINIDRSHKRILLDCCTIVIDKYSHLDECTKILKASNYFLDAVSATYLNGRSNGVTRLLCYKLEQHSFN